jgi:hypothetical protein
MKFVDGINNNLELVLGDLHPMVERCYEQAMHLFTRVGVNVCEWFEQNLVAIGPTG